jgi:hypothetical protein
LKSSKELADRLQTSAEKLDNVLDTGNRLLTESYPDARRMVLALRMGSENFEEATNLLKRKPWLVYNPAKESETYSTPQKTARDLELATRRFADLSSELLAIRKAFENDAGAPSREQLARLDFLIQELAVVSETLKFAGDTAKSDVLPPFERKKGGFVPVIEEFDPTLGRKKTEQP